MPMTDFMTVTVQPTCPGEHRSTVIHFHSSYCLCREGFKAQIWFPFFLLCFLSLYTCNAVAATTSGVKGCITGIRPAIQNSDAMLYAPSANGVGWSSQQKKDCRNNSLRCYMLELLMVIDEEAVTGQYADCISDFNAELPTDNSVGCPPCEVYPQKNITIFLRELQRLLEEINSIQNM